MVERLAASIEAAQGNAERRRLLGELAAIAPAPEERGPEALRARIPADARRWISVVETVGLPRQ